MGGQIALKTEPDAKPSQNKGVVQAGETVGKTPGENEEWVESIDKEKAKEPAKEQTEKCNKVVGCNDDDEVVVLGWRGRSGLLSGQFF